MPKTRNYFPAPVKKQCSCGKPWAYEQKTIFDSNDYYCVDCYKKLCGSVSIEAGVIQTHEVKSNVNQVELL